MPGPAKKLPAGPPNLESSGKGRNLYLIEMALGGCLLAMVIAIFYNSTRQEHESGDSVRPGSVEVNPNIVTLTAANWEKEVVQSKVPVVVDFWAPWCGPCRKLSPIVDRLADQYEGKVKFGKLNVDDAREIAERYGAKLIPQVSIFKGGATPRKTLVGGDAFGNNIAKALDSVLN